MAPHRRGVAAATRRQQQTASQPAKLGIQSFFGRNLFGSAGCTTASGKISKDESVAVSSESDLGKSGTGAVVSPRGEVTICDELSAAVEDGALNKGSDATSFCSHEKLSETVHVRRQHKRHRFSPNMVTQQSQDDGGDEVVWKVSPTAERLQGSLAVGMDREAKTESPILHPNNSVGNLPTVQKILSRATTVHAGQAVPPRRRKSSPGLAGKLEQWLLTSKIKPAEGDFGAPLKHVDIQNGKENLGTVLTGEFKISNFTKVLQLHSQHRASSSVPCRRSLSVKSQKKKGVPKEARTGPHRKALLELLNRVQNVIAVEDIPSEHMNKFPAQVDCSPTIADNCEIPGNGDVLKTSLTGSQTDSDDVSNIPLRGADSQFNINLEQHSNCLKQITDSEVAALDNLCEKSRDAESCNFCDLGEGCYLHQLDSNQQTDCGHDSFISSSLGSIHFLVLEVSDSACEKNNSSAFLPQKVLRLLNEQSGDERVVYLSDEWFYTVVRPGDTVNVIGEFDADGSCVINRNRNLLIVHPDLLISGSRVGMSFSCPRRAVLDERIRSNDFSLVALMGTMMHQLFQVGLVGNPSSKDILEHEAEVIVMNHIESLYAAGGTESEALHKLKDAIPTILNWVDCFLGSSLKVPTVEFERKYGQQKTHISEVVDIEEMIWSPKYGLKGMIDASVRVTLDGTKMDCIVPLEFKTGKATSGQAAVDHRAQVILYSLLMSDRYMENVDAGLLYYLFTNETKGVTVRSADLVGLMMRRNDHAANLLASSATQQLPPVLKNLHTCQGCWHLDVCLIYHKAQEAGTAESSGLGQLFNDQTMHLSGTHLEFLRSWDRLIDLEAQDLQVTQSEIWRMPSKQREEKGRCLSSMRIDLSSENLTIEENKTSHYVYGFHRKNMTWDQKNSCDGGEVLYQTGSLLERPFACGDRVLLSTESGNVAVAAGVIINISDSSIMLSLSHKLRLPGKAGDTERAILSNELWRIDKDEMASFLAIMRFNLLQLFVKDTGHDQGRHLIVDLKPPRFDIGGLLSQDPAVLYMRSAQGLNDDQRRAIHKILSAQDYALILGMPGTGKTSTIVHAVKALLTRGASVLLTSYTNSAVDNILLKLKEQGVDFVRLGRATAIHTQLQDHAIDGLNVTSVKDLELRMAQVHVVGATCLGITHPLLTNRKFDVCIVDEAGQITLPVCLGPLRFASKFVLVGDHYQLPPLVRNPEARERGLAVSLFRRLSEAHPEAISALQCQYRMCSGIMSLCNALIYGNRLRCGSHEVANAQLRIIGDLSCHPFWLQMVLSATHSVLFLDTDFLSAYETRMRSAIHNVIEASILLKVILALIDRGVSSEQIGVISPYKAQVEHIHRLLIADNLLDLEVQTIDKYQGRDKDCVLVSFVRSSNQGKNSSTLLSDWHRINVAITRAKKKLVLIGSVKTLSATPVLGLLIKQVKLLGGLIHLPQDTRVSLGCLKRCSTLTPNNV